MPNLRSKTRLSARVPLEIWTNIFSFLRRPIIPTYEDEPHCDISQRDLVNCMRVSVVRRGISHFILAADAFNQAEICLMIQAFNKAAAPILYSTIIVDKVEKLVIGLYVSSKVTTNASKSTAKAKKRSFPTKKENLAFVRRISFEYHPKLIRLSLDEPSEQRDANFAALSERVRNALIALSSCSTLTDRKPAHRVYQVCINRCRPRSGLVFVEDIAPDSGVDAALLCLVRRLQPTIACVAGDGIGLTVSDNGNAIPDPDSPHQKILIGRSTAAEEEAIRWIGHYEEGSTILFATFALRLAKIELTTISRPSGSAEVPKEDEQSASSRRNRNRLWGQREQLAMEELRAMNLAGSDLVDRVQSLQKAKNGVQNLMHNLDHVMLDNAFITNPILDADTTHAQPRQWTIYPPYSPMRFELDLPGQLNAQSQDFATATAGKRNGRNRTSGQSIVALSKAVQLVQTSMRMLIRSLQHVWSNELVNEAQELSRKSTQHGIDLLIQVQQHAWALKPGEGHIDGDRGELCPCSYAIW